MDRKEILDQLLHLHALLHRYQIRETMSFGPWGNPYRGQGRVLSVLKLNPEIGQKELAYILNMSKQALAELLSKLEKNGLVQRAALESDRRNVVVSLTEQGKKAAENVKDSPVGLSDLFEVFSEEEIRQYAALNTKLIGMLEPDSAEELDDDDPRLGMMRRMMRGRMHGPFEGWEKRFHHGFFRNPWAR